MSGEGAPGSGLEACADLVQRADPERFLATMALAPAERARLLPLYAFNLEIARAPWASPEPMIAEMRLQFWHDVLTRIGKGEPHHAHELAAPLREVIEGRGLPVCALQEMVTARRRDLERAPFAGNGDLLAYLDQTAGNLMWLAGMALGAGQGDETPLRQIGRAQGLANWLRAIPALEARGRQPLADGRPEAIADLARAALEGLAAASRQPHRQPHRQPLSPPARKAALAAFMARPVLLRAAQDPAHVAAGRLDPSEFRRRLRLLRLALIGGRI